MATSNATELPAKLVSLIAERSPFYEVGIQTTVCWKFEGVWRNLLTKFDFTKKGDPPFAEFLYQYPDLMIIRRLLAPSKVFTALERLVKSEVLESGHKGFEIVLQATFDRSDRSRSSTLEWSKWPADIFRLSPPHGQPGPADGALISVDAPYYPSFDQVLSDFYAIRAQGWMNYFNGQVVVVLPDFRARFLNLTVAPSYLKADIECGFLQPDGLIVKAYAEGAVGRLVQDTIRPTEATVNIKLDDKPSYACVALLCATSGEVLHEKVFKEGLWREPNIIVEPSATDLEQMRLTGESTTVEMREKLDQNRPHRLAKTVVAFANTKGGTIAFGVSDDNRVVGCTIQGMADTITNLIRTLCDPPPNVGIKKVTYEGKDLLLVEVPESSGVVHTVRELGPFIRANGTNRAPTSFELQALYQRRQPSSLLRF